jgi:hypothetical protein
LNEQTTEEENTSEAQQSENTTAAVIPQSGAFVDFVTKMCETRKWKTRELDNEHAVFEFLVDQTRSQTLFVFGFDDDVEFSVPSFAAFDTLEKVPHFISSSLLQLNAKMKIGFWCMETIGDKLVYTYMHNAKMSQIDETIFNDIVTTLVQRVDEFENLLIKMSGEGTGGVEPVQ